MAPCEWVIDIIQEWVSEQGFLTTSFVDRGDPAAWDFIKANFTIDGAWHDLDLSGIVPMGAKAVHFKVEAKATLINLGARFRKNDNAQDYNSSIFISQVANNFNTLEAVVALDSNRIIEYKFDGNIFSWTTIVLVVRSWFL